jgi:hypothetical protein
VRWRSAGSTYLLRSAVWLVPRRSPTSSRSRWWRRSKGWGGWWDGDQDSVVASGMGFADRLVLDLDPGVGGEGIGAHSRAPGGPGAVGAAVEAGCNRALQAALAGTAQTDRNHRLAGGVGLLWRGGLGAAAGEFQHGAQLPGAQADQQPGGAHREQGQHAVVRREPMPMFQGDGNAHASVIRFAARSQVSQPSRSSTANITVQSTWGVSS